MHTNLTPENVYLEPLQPSVQLVDVGFVQQDTSSRDTDNPEVATLNGTAGFLHRMVPSPDEC
jgi:hypothetical protein